MLKKSQWNLEENGCKEEKKNHHDWGNSAPERETLYVLTYKWTLVVKWWIVTLQSIDPGRLSNKEGRSAQGCKNSMREFVCLCVCLICTVIDSAIGGYRFLSHLLSFGLSMLWIENMAARVTVSVTAAVATSVLLGNTTASALQAPLLAPYHKALPKSLCASITQHSGPMVSDW